MMKLILCLFALVVACHCQNEKPKDTPSINRRFMIHETPNLEERESIKEQRSNIEETPSIDERSMTHETPNVEGQQSNIEERSERSDNPDIDTEESPDMEEDSDIDERSPDMEEDSDIDERSPDMEEESDIDERSPNMEEDSDMDERSDLEDTEDRAERSEMEEEPVAEERDCTPCKDCEENCITVSRNTENGGINECLIKCKVICEACLKPKDPFTKPFQKRNEGRQIQNE